MTTFKKALLLASMIVSLGACGPGGGGKATPDGGECQSADAGPAALQFIGTWQYAVETTNCTCDDGSTVTASADGSDIETFTAGCEANQVIDTGNDGCSLVCTVSGDVVTCDPGTCETQDGLDAKTTMDVYTLVSGQLQEKAGGTLTTPSGKVCQCTATDGVLTRIQ